MPKKLISIDLKKPASEQPVIHNRWHPDIPAIANVTIGDVFRVECFDCSGGQISNSDTADDMISVDWSSSHHLSGPIGVNEAEPGDLLVVDILDVGPIEGAEWGYTGSYGGGLLYEHFPDAAKAVWNFEGIYAVSRHIPGVRFPGMIHPGVIGCAPSHELLQKWNSREKALVEHDNDRKPVRAGLPYVPGTLLGKIPKSDEKWEKIAKEAARTIPPRENGGNCDIKNLSKGSRIYFPVFVKGANLSVGDIHFSQGDGEIAFCGGIEMSGWVDMKISNVIKGGMKLYETESPIYMPGPVEPKFSSYLTFEGISVDDNGVQHYMDATLSYKQACLKAIRYLTKFGYTKEQALFILSTVPCEGRVSCAVDVPNAMCTIGIPTEVFEFEIRPNQEGPKKVITSPHASCKH